MLMPENGFEALTRLIELGGPVVVVLLLLSMVAAATIVYKLLQLRRYSAGYFHALADRMSRSPAEVPADDVIGELLGFALAEQESRPMEPSHSLQHGTSPTQALEAEVSRRGSHLLSGLSRYLRLLELIAYISPLLGLLGTVLGMIDAFRGLEVEVNQADAGVLAGGIWEALLTTAMGLGIAIPVAAAHALLEGRVQRIGEQLQDILQQALSP